MKVFYKPKKLLRIPPSYAIGLHRLAQLLLKVYKKKVRVTFNGNSKKHAYFQAIKLITDEKKIHPAFESGLIYTKVSPLGTLKMQKTCLHFMEKMHFVTTRQTILDYVFPLENQPKLVPRFHLYISKVILLSTFDKYNSKRNYENSIRTWAPNYAIAKK